MSVHFLAAFEAISLHLALLVRSSLVAKLVAVYLRGIIPGSVLGIHDGAKAISFCSVRRLTW